MVVVVDGRKRARVTVDVGRLALQEGIASSSLNSCMYWRKAFGYRASYVGLAIACRYRKTAHLSGRGGIAFAYNIHRVLLISFS